jgi:hypothetical protein
VSCRAIGFLAALCCAADSGAAATASGKNWRLSIDSLECQGALMMLGTKIRYLGPKGPVEAPIIQVVDARGTRHPPRSLVWKQGAKSIADWMSGGGLAVLQSHDIGEVQLRFPVPEAGGELKLEFGDIPAFALTKGGCAGLLPTEALKAPRRGRAATAKTELRVYRHSYPCTAGSTRRIIEAGYPPYLPRQLLVFGRGYLPNLREVALPMGRAAAQSYAFSGADDMKAVDALARRVAASDFSGYGAAKHFVFDWGLQRSASGNELHSAGIYGIGPCPAEGDTRK